MWVCWYIQEQTLIVSMKKLCSLQKCTCEECSKFVEGTSKRNICCVVRSQHVNIQFHFLILWFVVMVKGCSHGAIVATIYLSQVMGCMEFNVVVTIVPWAHERWVPYNLLVVIKNHNHNRTVWTDFNGRVKKYGGHPWLDWHQFLFCLGLEEFSVP